VTDGLPLAEAVRQATDPQRWRAIPLLYGDGLRVLCRTSGTMRGDDSYRQVSALSYDIADSTRLLASLGAESYSELLASCHRRCAAIASAHGGVADDAHGDDGVMCYFGFPVAAEDSATRCVQAALEMVDAASLLGIGLRIGISTGKVAVTHQPIGVTIHHAARLRRERT
jgi:class 3 adenylate cyclase